MVLTRPSRAGLALSLLATLLSAVPPARAEEAGGVVRMTRAEYDRLKDEAETARLGGPKRKAPDAPPSLLSATYALGVDASRASLDVTAEVDVPTPDGRTVLSGLGLLDALADSGPAPVLAFAEEGKGDRLVLHFEKAGRYRVTLRSIPAERTDRDRRVVEFTALPAASARLTASSSVPGSELALAAGAGSPAEPLTPNAARPVPASAFVRLEVKTPGRVPAAPEKPVVIAETLDVLRPERERLAHRVLVRLAVSRGELASVTTAVPAGSELVASSVPDDAVASLDAATGLLTLSSPRPFRAAETFSFLLHRPLPASAEGVEAAPARVLEASATRSWLLVSPTPAREHVPGTVGGMARVDTADLPPIVRPFVEGGTRAYRVAAPEAAKLAFRAPLRRVEAPPDAVLYEASLLTVLSPTAARVDRQRYVVETRRPSWSLPLLPDEEVLSVSVDGTPVRPLSGEGTLVVLLPPASEAVRTVEVTRRRKAETVPDSGDVVVSHPALPATAGLVTWTLVLPEERRYRFVSSEGLDKAGWSRDEPAVARRFQGRDDGWMARQEVTVTGEAPMVDTSRSSVGQSFSADQRYPAKVVELGKRKDEPKPSAPAEAVAEEDAGQAVAGGVVGGVAGGVEGGMAAGAVLGGKPDDIAITPQSNVAGIRSLPMRIEGRGKRLTLVGLVAGGAPLAVTLKVKKG